MFNERGQAFSAFQLLIAAVVAMAILGILMAIIGGIGPIGTHSDPTKQVADKIQELRERGGYEKTEVVTFDSDTKKYMRSSEIISEADVGMSTDQVCLSLGDFSDSERFDGGQENGSPKLIAYNGTGTLDVKLSVLCNVGTMLEDDIDEIGEYEGLDSDWISDCPCVDQDEMCCVVMLRKR